MYPIAMCVNIINILSWESRMWNTDSQLESILCLMECLTEYLLSIFYLLEVSSNASSCDNWKCLQMLSNEPHLLIWSYYVSYLVWLILVDFQMLNQHHIPEIKSTWLWYIIFFLHCWIQFAKLFVEAFCTYVYRRC